MLNKSQAKLGVFSLAMISVAGIFTLRTLPLMAEYGITAITLYVLAAILFLLPTSFACAELATGWPKTGGLYVWIREAFGSRIGFLGIWLEWTNTVISFPATLAFITATLAYVIDPKLADNKTYMLVLMLSIFWGTTFINFMGIKFSSMISNLGLILGTVLPCFLIMGLSIWWIASGNPIQVHFSWHALIPHLDFSHSAFLVGLLLGFSGMQIAAFHAQETKNPQRDFPRAVLFSVLIILFLSIFGSLAISIVIPQEKISLVAGLMQATQIFFSKFHMAWMVPVIAILTALGTLAMLNLWVIGPCKGLLATAQHGDLPKLMKTTNRYGTPTTLLLLQALVGTLFALVYLFMPSVNSSYWILIALTAVLTLLMNILLLASVIRLRYSKPNVPRSYKIPGGKLGVWIIAGLGIIVCAAAFFLGFALPAQLKTGNAVFYEFFLILGVIIIASIPFLMPNIGSNQDRGLRIED